MAKSKSGPNDVFATAETLKYIRGLHENLLKAQSDLSSTNIKLANLQNEQTNAVSELKRIQAEQADIQASIDQAKTAETNVMAIITFFEERVSITEGMAKHAEDMARYMFDATEEMNEKGISAIEKIQRLVSSFNSKPDVDPSEKWSSLFGDSLTDASAYGATAFSAAKKATKSAFMAYVKNRQIAVRTRNYLSNFLMFKKELADFIIRKKQKQALVDRRALELQTRRNTLDEKVKSTTATQQQYTFQVNKLQSEFTAAQLSAEFTFTTAAAPA